MTDRNGASQHVAYIQRKWNKFATINTDLERELKECVEEIKLSSRENPHSCLKAVDQAFPDALVLEGQVISCTGNRAHLKEYTPPNIISLKRSILRKHGLIPMRGGNKHMVGKVLVIS